jgi:hypothetical protein
MSSFLFIILPFTTTIDLRLMGTSPDEDLISCVHVAHGLEVSSQTNRDTPPGIDNPTSAIHNLSFRPVEQPRSTPDKYEFEICTVDDQLCFAHHHFNRPNSISCVLPLSNESKFDSSPT